MNLYSVIIWLLVTISITILLRSVKTNTDIIINSTLEWQNKNSNFSSFPHLSIKSSLKELEIAKDPCVNMTDCFNCTMLSQLDANCRWNIDRCEKIEKVE